MKITHLFIVLTLAAASFHEDETFGTLDFFITQGSTLTVLDSKVVSGAVNEFKSGKNFRELSLDGLVKR